MVILQKKFHRLINDFDLFVSMVAIRIKAEKKLGSEKISHCSAFC